MKKLILLLILSFACLFAVSACGEQEQQPETETPVAELSQELKNAKSYLTQMYGDGTKVTSTAADKYYISKAVISGKTLAVAWSVDKAEVEVSVVAADADKNAGMTLVKVPTPGAAALDYTLTATVTGTDGSVLTMSWLCQVPAAQSKTIAEFIAAQDTESYTALTGIITAVNGVGKADSFILSDETGSIFCYDKIEVTLGDKVTIIGQLSLYGDAKFPQLAKPAVSQIHSSGNDVKAASGTPVAVEASTIKSQLSGNLTELYAGKFLAITGYAMLNSSGYVNMEAVAGEGTACVNIYANDTIDLKPYVGQKITVYGFMRGSSASYLTLQTQSFEVVQEELTDAQKAERAANALSLSATEFSSSQDIELPATGANDTTITWELVGDALPEFKVENGKLVVTVGENNATQVLKATVACGEATATKEFTLTVSAELTFTAIADANAIAAAKEHNTYTSEKYVVVGTVKEIVKEEYGNLYITDGTNDLYVYGTYINGTKYGDVTDKKFAVGDTIVVKGVLGQYNGQAQMKNADLVAWEPATTHETIALDAANKLGVDQGTGNYTADKYTVKGIITKVANTKYGNIYIEDVYGNEFYIYGLYSADGATSYEALTVKPVEGDFIVVTGIVGNFKDAPQMKNGWLLEHVSFAPAASEPDTPDTPVVTGGVVIADYAAANSWTDATVASTLNYDAATKFEITAATPASSHGQNTGKYYASNQTWRFYQNENPTITVTSTKTIASVTFEYAVKNTGILTINGTNCASGTSFAVNGNTFTLSVGQTGSATNGNVQITKIIITYAE